MTQNALELMETMGFRPAASTKGKNSHLAFRDSSLLCDAQWRDGYSEETDDVELMTRSPDRPEETLFSVTGRRFGVATSLFDQESCNPLKAIQWHADSMLPAHGHRNLSSTKAE
jgi:hypothetical protein